MNPIGPTRFRQRKSLSSDRLIGVFLHTPPENPNAIISGAGGGDDDDGELNEDEVFWNGDFAEPNNHYQSNTPSTSARRTHQHHKGFGSFVRQESFGILAALPENETRSVFNHKASMSSSSSSSSSSSRMIPVMPKPPLNRPSSVSSSAKYHPQSAPVNVPLLPKSMRRNYEFDEVDADDEEGEGEVLPPHEIAARADQSPLVACSVLEGVGRTLKGRDLRQVRNAVWRRTGFLD